MPQFRIIEESPRKYKVYDMDRRITFSTKKYDSKEKKARITELAKVLAEYDADHSKLSQAEFDTRLTDKNKSDKTFEKIEKLALKYEPAIIEYEFLTNEYFCLTF